MPEFWIQIESNPWDMNPHNRNRMTGETTAEADKIEKDLKSPVTGITRTVKMVEPVDNALILRRYTEKWAAPDDRKVNPWDLNEPDPTDTGTMGTIPGPTIECNVGDEVIVHFRNMDSRSNKSVEERAHSLHPHGIVFAAEYDGAYPLSPPDLTQPVTPAVVDPTDPTKKDEAALWALLGVTGNKIGDRLPPGATFTYRWNTFGWPSTAGVWLYHDHSICDHHNVELGAIGILVIHNPADEDDVLAYDDTQHPALAQDLPGGQPNGSLTKWCYFPFRLPTLRVSPFALKRISSEILDEIKGGFKPVSTAKKGKKSSKIDGPDFNNIFLFENKPVELAVDRRVVTAFFRRCFVAPPKKALYLQLYHEMMPEQGGTAMSINGRRWLGNTPTLIGGLDTKMRFGLVAMNLDTIHTFHLHAHRWVIPGPSGGKVGGDVPVPGTGIQISPLDQGASQFEDTRIFGPANSFGFTINQGSFMGPPLVNKGALGEWHMHCHVLAHMMGGMMGSLLIIEDGDDVIPLPSGVPCEGGEPPVLCDTVEVDGFAFDPAECLLASGTEVTFNFSEANHTVTTVSTTGAAGTIETPGGIEINGPGKAGDDDPANSGVEVPVGVAAKRTVTGNPGDEINYMCGIHGATMSGKFIII